VDIIAVIGDAAAGIAPLLAAEEGGESGGLVINFFWILVSALNFLLLLLLLRAFAFGPVAKILDERRQRIEQGLKDADEARVQREQAAAEKHQLLGDARREANEIVTRAQRVAEETRERELAEARTELERVRAAAVAEIESERLRALADVRAEVADLALAAAGKVVGETMNAPRERRLVEEFLADVGGGSGGEPQTRGAGS